MKFIWLFIRSLDKYYNGKYALFLSRRSFFRKKYRLLIRYMSMKDMFNIDRIFAVTILWCKYSLLDYFYLCTYIWFGCRGFHVFLVLYLLYFFIWVLYLFLSNPIQL